MSSMRDVMAGPQRSEVDLVAEAACCPGEMCGPIFAIPLVELAFKRVRLRASRRAAPQAVERGADPILDPVRSIGPSVRLTPDRPQEDASHD
jgi:hypothetical protein